MAKRIATEQPDWVCDDCGIKYGDWYVNKRNIPMYCATYHHGTCGVCHREHLPVTEARDFGYLVEWQPRLLKG